MDRRIPMAVSVSLLAMACGLVYVERSAPEAGTIGDTRMIISAEAAYQSVNSGYYGTITCLASPTACLPSYPRSGPTFLDPSFAAATVTKRQYTRQWFETKSAPGAPPGSIERFCYAATTEVSGLHAIGGDSTGIVGVARDNSTVCCTPDAQLDLSKCPPLK